MIRVNKLILKSTIFDVMQSDEVVSVSMLSRKNKNLNNPDICRVYLKMKIPKGDLSTIFGMIETADTTYLSAPDIDFLRGIMSHRNLGWLSVTQVKHILEISKNSGINFAISKSILKIINIYK